MIKIGEPITEDQKAILQRILTTNDLVEISTQVKVSYATVRNIFYRTQSITEDNQEAAYKMINKAFEKAEDAIVYFAKAKSELERMLPKAG